MAAPLFQRGENHQRRVAFPQGFLLAGLLIAVPTPAAANEAAATAAFPLIGAHAPTATPTGAFAPTAAYTAGTVPVTPPPPAVPPANGPAVPASPYEPPYESPAAPAPNQAPVGFDPALDRRDSADKERDRRREAWLLAVEGYTTAPIDVGGRVTFETPFRLRLSAAYGIVPGTYFGVVNDVVESSGAYDSFGMDFVEASLDDGHVWRAMIGLRPVGGLYLDAGYARIALAGGLQADQFGYSIESTLHMFTADIGFQGAIADHLLLALGVGVMKTVSAESTVAANFELGNSTLGRAVTADAVREYDSKLEEYGIVPTVTLRVGWDFF